MLRYVNFILFALLGGAFLLFFQTQKITQEVLDLFPTTQDRKIIDIYQQFSASNYIPVAIKGFDESSNQELDTLLKRIESLDNVISTQKEAKPSAELEDFITKNYLYLASPKDSNPPLLSQAQIAQKLSMGLINPLDPLGLFALPQSAPKTLMAKDYGYMALVELKSLDDKPMKQTLQDFREIAKDYPTLHYFSPKFMMVENLDLILSEVNFLLGFASLVFITLYFVIIRIPLLTLNTICTLICSNIIAIFVVSSVYPKVTIMALSFGMGISNIAIDYMMHHNFFGLYAQNKRVFNRPVFYGYITTIVGFGACLFIPFPLLAQLALYAIISLSIAYISFAFLYPRIGFSQPRLFPYLASLRFPRVPSVIFLTLAFVFFAFSASHLKLDFDLSKLDYQNEPMLAERDFFDKALNEDKTQILLSASSVENLIMLSKSLQQKINTESTSSNPTFIPLSLLPTQTQIEANRAYLQSDNMQQNKAILKALLPNLQAKMTKEAKDDSIHQLFAMLQMSYDLPQEPILDMDTLGKLGFALVTDDKDSLQYYYLAEIEKVDLALVQKFAQNLDSDLSQQQNITEHFAKDSANIETRPLQSIMDHLTDGIYQPMLVVLGIAFVLMISTLFFTAKGAFFDAVVFILFPLSAALFVVALHSPLNIMHLFALLILVVVSVDYGIYSVKEGDNPRTAHAIFFSSITTGLSFGILITSHTKALNSFGEVIFTGMCCVLLMLVFHKAKHKINV
ncbi:hypothetical protein LS68_001225 [Helicobacter sp. MIT 05-5293]|uniref:hypothetical protein n=1 Tax=Helicobacter sp. MIT 05-5293 TaxID=1548149 RepID=UPI00051E13F2|nr:hypothetical protein [Helicobacter sp. MIT 05-5293]TLD81682.1 hypothetical protein LS68_001225 [Helicobacter sp. MIT 05-5293]